LEDLSVERVFIAEPFGEVLNGVGGGMRAKLKQIDATAAMELIGTSYTAMMQDRSMRVAAIVGRSLQSTPGQ
jgi:hypothetical protein